MEPVSDPRSPADFVATLLHLLGVDAGEDLQTPDGRPIPLVERGGRRIREVLV